MSSVSTALFSLSSDSFGKRLTQAAALDRLGKRLVVFGEIHSLAPCVALQCAV